MTWNRTLIIFLLGIVALFFYPFSISLLVGVIFSTTLSPFMDRLPHNWSRIKKTSTVTVIFTLLLVLPISLIVFFGAIEGKALFNNMSELDYSEIVKKTFTWFNSFDSLSFLFKSFQINVNNIENNILKLVLSLKNWLFIILQSIVTSIPYILFSFILIVATVFFSLLDGDKLKEPLLKNNFYSHEFGKSMTKVFQDVSRSVVLATLGSAIAQAGIILIPALFFDFKYSLLIVFSTFIFSFIPVVGTAPIIVALLLFKVLQGDWTALVVYGLFAIFLGSVDNIIRAKIISTRVQVNPFVAFLATLGGLNLIGFWGLFVGPVIVITSLKLLKLLLEPHPHPEKTK